jgi:hypothetical protein
VDADDDTYLDVTYRASPPKLATTVTEPETAWIELPDQLMIHLLTYVGYRAHVAMPNGEASKGREHLAGFLRMCEDTKLFGTLDGGTNANTTTEKLDNNGWA